MFSNRLLMAMMILMASAVFATPVLAKKVPPPVNEDGMQLIKNSQLDTVYANPGADLGVYNRIWLQDATVTFKKNWQRDQNRGNKLKVRNSDVERIQTEVAELFREVLTKELTAGGYELVEENGDDVLKVVPAIVELDIFAPDIQDAGRTYSYSESAGEMTLNLALLDSVSGDTLVQATDRQRDFRQGFVEWRTRVSNRSDARRMMSVWAKSLRSTLDDARS